MVRFRLFLTGVAGRFAGALRARRSSSEALVSHAPRGDDADSALEVDLTDIDALRALTLPGTDAVRTRNVRLRVRHWRPVTGNWGSTPRGVPHLRSVKLDLDPANGCAEVEFLLAEDARLSDLARAFLSSLVPDRHRTGPGTPRLTLSGDASASILRLLPSFAAPPTADDEAPGGLGRRRSADLELESSGSLVSVAWETDTATASGRRTASVTATDDAVIDIRLHNPIGRSPAFRPSTGQRRLSLSSSNLHVERLEAGRLVSEQTIPLDRPLDRDVVAAIRDIESLSLSSVDLQADSRLADRLAELAACGTILHDLPDDSTSGGRLDTDLEKLFRLPYASAIGLERETRSVEQRRTALLRHGGMFRLAGAATALGHRLLPSVSVVISSRRPDLAPRLLRMFAAQTYVDLEVVLVMHEAPMPDLAGMHDRLDGLDYRLVAADAGATFGDALATGARRSSGDLVVKADDDDIYGPHHIHDLVLAWFYSGADLVGKPAAFAYLQEADLTAHRSFGSEMYHHQVAGGTMLLSRGVLNEIGGWRPTPALTDRTVLDAVAESGGTIYRTHDLEYLYVRRHQGHTWERSDAHILDGSFEQWHGLRYPGFDPID